MKLDKPRVAPIEAADWTPAQAEVIGPQTMRGNVPNVFKTLVHHEKLAKRWLVFATHVLSKNTMSPREREIAILRTGWLAGSDYEWAQHVIIGEDAGLARNEIEAIKEGASNDCWSSHEKWILRACDELDDEAFLSDETWQGLSETYSTQQLLDLIFTCGQYRMLAGALNSLGVPLDEDIR